jgi:hypothetical protein
MKTNLNQSLWISSKIFDMGNTYRKEKVLDERNSNKPRKRWSADIDRKQNKNQRLIDVVYEDDEFIDFEDEYESGPVQHNKKK